MFQLLLSNAYLQVKDFQDFQIPMLCQWGVAQEAVKSHNQDIWLELAERIFHSPECHAQYKIRGEHLVGTRQLLLRLGMVSKWWETVQCITCLLYLVLHFITIITIFIIYFIYIISLFLYQTKDFIFPWFSTPSHQGAGGVSKGMCGP